jgi:poly-gamma-glutamate synthesis protein (capsule biosynthesis protein)
MRSHAIPTFFLALVILVGASAMAFAQNSTPITLTFAGDLMLGRTVAPVAAADPDGLFRDVRHVLRASELSFANLESPLTTRAHLSANPDVLIADPAIASVVADAGLDVLSLANNHADDAGQGGIEDTVAVLQSAGIHAVGAPDTTPLLVEVGGIRVAAVAFDVEEPWDEHEAQRIIAKAAPASDLLVVSVHGGVSMLPEPDPRIERLSERLVSWGADVVWGHGPHVVQPVTTVERPRSGTAVVATSLGNFLFDQRGPLTGQGALLQVRVDRHGVIGYRIGRTTHHDLRVHFTGWDLPVGVAVAWDGEWWTPTRPVPTRPTRSGLFEGFAWGEVIVAGQGRITGDDQQIVVSFRKAPGPHPVRDGMPDVRWTDSEGRSHHLGIYRAADLTPVWVAGTVPAPIMGLAVCDGSVALAYGTLDHPAVVSAGAAVWRPVGLDPATSLPGPGTPGCADVDGDGRTEPVILDR